MWSMNKHGYVLLFKDAHLNFISCSCVIKSSSLDFYLQRFKDGKKVLAMCVHVLVAQLCPTLCDPIDCSLPGFSVHEILQARILVCTKSLQSYLTLCDSMDCIPPGSSVLGILEWVTMPFSRGSSWPRDRTQVSWFVTVWATREAQFLAHRSYKTKQQSRLVLQAIVLQPLL